MDTRVIWQEGLTFTGTADSGFSVPLGASAEVGGADDGFRPLELMGVSLAGCTAMDVISILKKKRQDITAFEVRVHADTAREHPHVFTHVKIEYIVTGRRIDPVAVERALELSKNTYCPAQAMLARVVEIELSYRIIEAA
ncbi:MAG: OsmC family protein [Chloroflexi bacterium]|nr:OsmC family protein [Chloroflexota bacterium]